MKHDDNNGELILSTGKKIDIYSGFIGINKAGDLSGGYDNYIYSNNWDEGNRDYKLTKLELIEIADYMISVWNKFKENKYVE